MAYSQDDDFEIIDAQSPPATGLHVVSMAEAELPIRQKKVSPDEEETTERAIKPLVSLMQETTKLQEKSGPIFQRAAIEKDGSSSHVRDNIFEAFVTGLPVEEQQMMNCNACKKFMSQYGDLCTVGEDGSLLPLMWPTDTEKVPQYYRKSVEHVLTLLETSGGTVGDEFAIQDKAGRVLGVPKTGAWSHMSITLTEIRITRANDPMKSQDTTTSHNMLNAILERNPAGVVERAHHYLGQNLLPYAESHKSAIIYLQNTVQKLAGIKNTMKRKNLTTKLARDTFPGCLSSLNKAGMIGTLLESIKEGKDFEAVKRSWEALANPISYLRPTAAPSAGNVESAEKIFASLGYTPHDLERVYMTLDQVPKSGFLWSPPSTEAPAEKPVKVSTSTEMFEERPAKRQKLFTSVIPKVGKLSAVKEIQFNEAPLKDISFRKFALKILPTISSLAVLIPAISVQPYFFSTGKPDAKPIMAFHKEGGHTGSWYTWGDRGIPFRASLKGNSWTPVNGIISFPHMWDEFESAADALDETKAEAFKFKRHGIHFLFCLEGAKENDTERELCLFPTLMRGEFHPVRSTVEAFSRKGKMGLPEEGKPLAAGLMVEKNERGCEMTVGVKTTTGQVCRYNIKLFD